MYGYGDDFERFAFFTKACLEAINCIDFIPDIIHFNDWQTALGPVYLKDNYGGFIAFTKIKTLLTVHNLQYQGVFGPFALGNVGLNDGYFTTDKLEFNNTVNFLKGGLVYADAISTVSDTYAQEIQTPEYGYGLDGVLRSQSHKLCGILNGIDNDLINPETDPKLDFTFTRRALSGKKKNKKALQEQLGLPIRDDVPVISIISRLVEQKGFDLISVAMEELLSKDIQLVVLGTGDSRFEGLFKHMVWRAPEKISANIYFNE
jgi:starch synthase